MLLSASAERSLHPATQCSAAIGAMVLRGPYGAQICIEHLGVARCFVFKVCLTYCNAFTTQTKLRLLKPAPCRDLRHVATAVSANCRLMQTACRTYHMLDDCRVPTIGSCLHIESSVWRQWAGADARGIDLLCGRQRTHSPKCCIQRCMFGALYRGEAGSQPCMPGVGCCAPQPAAALHPPPTAGPCPADGSWLACTCLCSC